MRLLLLLLSTCSVLSLLKITSPIVNNLTNNEIPYTMGNFGDIPHENTTLKGNLKMDHTQIDLCSPISNLKDNNVVLLAQRGKCSFVRKVLNGQNAGAMMVIIADNIIEDSEHFVMADDGNGRSVHIPSIFINEANGEILESLVSEQNPSVSLEIRFTYPKTVVVNMTLFLNILDRHSALMAREIHQAVTQFPPNQLNLNISYYTVPCSGCDPAECYSNWNKDYCLITGKRKGAALVNLLFKQYLVFLASHEDWFRMYEEYDLECEEDNAQSCLENILYKAGYLSNSAPAADNLQMLESWRSNALKTGVTTYPGISVNGLRYPDSSTNTYISEKICSSLLNPPSSVCSQFGYLSTPQEPSQVSFILWAIAISLISAGLIVMGVWIYRRIFKKEITNEMSLKVTEMVTQYIKMAEDQQQHSRNREIEKSREDL